MAKGQAVADKINQEVGAQRVTVVEVTKPEQTAEAIKGAEIVLSAGAGGIQLLSAADLDKVANMQNRRRHQRHQTLRRGRLRLKRRRQRNETRRLRHRRISHRQTENQDRNRDDQTSNDGAIGTVRLRNSLHNRKRPNPEETRKSSCQISSSFLIFL